MRFVTVLCFLFLAIPGVSLAAGGEDIVFVERPGEIEFSGQMIARPLQIDALQRLGIDSAEISVRRRAAAARLDAWRIDYQALTDEHIFAVPEGHDENSIASLLMATGGYQYVEPDWICYPIDTIPNDPNYGQQWHHPVMDCPKAWDLFTGDVNRIAAVVDTGVDKDHPDLQARLLPGYNSVDRLTEAQGGDVNDINGHGTLTIGCVGAIGNNNTLVAGVNWTISLLPIRTSNSSGGSASLSDLSDGALWAASNGAKTISVSYSGVESASVGTTGTTIKNMDALLFWAAGNSNANLSGFDWDDVIVVAATDQNDNKASFSSYGLAVDCAAPGVDITSTTNGGGSGAASGTSFSTPLTNGVAALLWAYAPGLSADDAEQILFDSCDDVGNSNLGYGRVNAFNALSSTALTIAFPVGLPQGFQRPGPSETITIEIVPAGENYVPGTGFLYYRFESSSNYTQVALTPLGGDLFEASLPNTAPGDAPEFYFSAQGDGGTTITSPPDAPTSVYSFDLAFILSTVFSDNFQNDLGWTVENQSLTTGAWVRAVPSGSGGTRGDPLTDGDNSGQCFVTGNGFDEDVDGGPTRVVSPTLDLSAVDDVLISYYAWFTNDDADDPYTVAISSNNGSTWTQAASHSPAGNWRQFTFRASDFTSLSNQMKIRFVTQDNPNDSVTEGGVDGVSVQEVDFTPGLWADAYSFSSATGSNIVIDLDAGAAFAGRQYTIVGGFSGSDPGTPLSSGLILPVNFDFLTNYILANLNNAVFQNFTANLDGNGQAQANLVIPAGLASSYIGNTMTLAYTLNTTFDYVSNPMGIQIEP